MCVWGIDWSMYGALICVRVRVCGGGMDIDSVVEGVLIRVCIGH